MPAAISATRRLRDIWENSEPIAFTRRRTVDDLWGFCRTCYYAEICMGGCTWTSHALFGRPGNNPMCHHRALEMDKAGPARAAGQGEGRARPLVRPWRVRDRRRAGVRAPCRAGSRTGSRSMAEQGRVAPRLRLCRGCRQFVTPRPMRIARSAAAISTRSRPSTRRGAPRCTAPRTRCARRWPSGGSSPRRLQTL